MSSSAGASSVNTPFENLFNDVIGHIEWLADNRKRIRDIRDQYLFNSVQRLPALGRVVQPIDKSSAKRALETVLAVVQRVMPKKTLSALKKKYPSPYCFESFLEIDSMWEKACQDYSTMELAKARIRQGIGVPVSSGVNAVREWFNNPSNQVDLQSVREVNLSGKGFD